MDQLTAHTDQAGLTSTFTYDAQGRIKRAASGPFARTYNYALADSPVGISSALTGSAAGQPAQQARSQERSYGPLGLIEQRTNDQAPVYPIADALGNTLGELGEDGKAELLPETDPWGEVVVREAGANPESPIDAPTSGFLGAAGRIELPSGGLTKLGARYYDSGIGAFISVDPVTGGPEEPIRRAGYLYGAGNPARFVDVDGESFGDAIAGAYNDVTAPIKSKAEAISMELGRISSDPSSSGLERFSANFYGGLSSLASCESFDETAAAILFTPLVGALALKGARALTPMLRRLLSELGDSPAAQRLVKKLLDETGSLNPRAQAGRAGGNALETIGHGLYMGSKIARQLESRGWSRELIVSTIKNPARTVVVRDTRHLPGGAGRLNDPAVAFYRADGHYVVRNSRTGEIVQISNRNKKDWVAPWD